MSLRKILVRWGVVAVVVAIVWYILSAPTGRDDAAFVKTMELQDKCEDALAAVAKENSSFESVRSLSYTGGFDVSGSVESQKDLDELRELFEGVCPGVRARWYVDVTR